MDFSTIEGLVSAFQNGMTLAYSLKNGCTIDQNLRSCVFGQNFDKTSGGYLGHLKPFFGATKGMDGCPLMGIQGFWRQKPILRTSFYKYHIMTHCWHPATFYVSKNRSFVFMLHTFSFDLQHFFFRIHEWLFEIQFYLIHIGEPLCLYISWLIW